MDRTFIISNSCISSLFTGAWELLIMMVKILPMLHLWYTACPLFECQVEKGTYGTLTSSKDRKDTAARLRASAGDNGYNTFKYLVCCFVFLTLKAFPSQGG